MSTNDSLLTRKLIEHLAIVDVEGNFHIYGLPHSYIQRVYPDMDWSAMKAICLSPEDTKRMLIQVADILGYRLTKV